MKRSETIIKMRNELIEGPIIKRLVGFFLPIAAGTLFQQLYNAVDADKYVLEFCVIVPYGRGRENNPATFAHEMLHCFGAYDLYETNQYSPIPQKYVDYLMSHKPNDLMNHCYYSASDIVTVEFSEVDAYYVGLTDTCAAKKKWGLGESLFRQFPVNY